MTVDQPLRAGRREWIGLAVLALPTLLLSVDLSVLFLAVPHLSADLDADSIEQLWITDIYGFMLAGFLVTMGTLGDRVGRRRLMLIGASAFAVASVLAAFATSPEMLIVFRALMGIAGATLGPSTLALISNMFQDPGQRGIGISVWVSCFTGGMAIGPVIGGILLEHFWWGSVFLLGVPVMLLLLITAPFLLPEYRDTAQSARVDLLSAVLSLAAILLVVYGLKELANHGLTPMPLVAVVGGVAFGVLFVIRQRGLASPLLDLRLFQSRSFSVTLVIMLLTAGIQGGSYFLVAQFLQTVEGLSPLQAGLWMVPATCALVVGSLAAPHLARRIVPAYVMAAGLAISAIGYLLSSQVESTGSLALLVIGFVLIFLGVGPQGALCTDMIVGTAPPEKAGSAASTSETSGELGIALGIATLGSLGGAVYSSRLGDTMPSDVPPEAAAVAGESVADAVATADLLPEETRANLLDAAHESFTTAFTVAHGLGALLFVGLAVAAGVALRHVRPGGPAPEDERSTTADASADPAH